MLSPYLVILVLSALDFRKGDHSGDVVRKFFVALCAEQSLIKKY